MGTTYKELFKLYDLIQNGDARAVARFLETPTEINTIIPCKGIGVLHLAVGIEPEEKSRDCTELLLKSGGNPNLCNDDGVTPVHIAAIWGRVENMKLLLACGGDVTMRDLDGMSASDYAVREQQWAVCDYLNDLAQLNDCDDDECAYTLELDKILVTTDDVVAEYELVNDETSTRKSEIVRNWCETNSLNKLYPTILAETYDNESIAWARDNITLDLTIQNYLTNSHSDSFKTCQSKRSSEISGVKPLECTCDSTRRNSVYKNFSLPGSPKLITHKNYNTKCSLRSKEKDSLISSDRSFSKSQLTDELNKLRIDKPDEFKKPKLPDSDCKRQWVQDEFRNRTNESLISSDRSLDKAMAVVQNRTNEWLHDVGLNTRRSSASSGVSSNYSSGGIVLANVHHEYKYTDLQQNVQFIEKRLTLSPVILPVEDAPDGSPDQTVLSMASSLPTSVKYDDTTLRAELLRLGFNPGPIKDSTRTLYLKKLYALKKNTADDDGVDKKVLSPTPSLSTSVKYDNETLRAELQKLGFNPGPIQDSTRTLYVKKLHDLKKDTPVVEKQEKAYSLELKKSLRSDEWMTNLTPYIELDKKVRANFLDPSKKWREGNSKTSFTYLLLDPRMTDNLPVKQNGQSKLQAWVTFVNSIFYVGKGKRSRPYAHLYQALTLWKRGFATSDDKKVQHILDIWQSKVGVVCLHIFQNVIPAEAYTNEAAMIDAIGVSTLKNLKSGTYYGVAASWPLRDRRMLGLYLLYKAMQIFMNEGERQLRPDDI